MAKDDLIRFDPDDPRFKADPYGATIKPEREKRQLSPEMEKQFNEATPVSAFLRNAANAFSFNQADRLATITGAPLDEQHELSARLEEKFPKSSLFGGIGGSMVGGAGLSKLAAKAVPAFAGNTLKSAALREGSVAAGTAAASEGIKSAEDRGEFSPGHVAASTLLGGGMGAVASQLPAVFGHAQTIASKARDKPFTAAQKANMEGAGNFGEAYGFKGDAGLDMAQRARFTEDPDLAGFAANVERMKARGGPATTKPQEDAFKAGGLDKYMDASVSSGGRQYPEMSGKAVGQTRGGSGQTGEAFANFGGIPADTVFRPQGPLPKAAEDALETAYQTRSAVHNAQRQYGTSTTGRADPQRYEFRMWEDALNPKINPMSREDLRDLRMAFGQIIPEGGIGKDIAIPGQGRPSPRPPMANRMGKEIEADDVARIRGSIKDAPQAPEWLPDSVPVGLSMGALPGINRIPGLRTLGGLRLGVDVPVSKFPTRHAAAADIAKDPSMADIIGRLTNAQATTGGATRGMLEALINSLSR
jgi:hypothetical protein